MSMKALVNMSLCLTLRMLCSFYSMQSSWSRRLMTLCFPLRNMLTWSFLEEGTITLLLIWLPNTSTQNSGSMISAKSTQMFMSSNQHFRLSPLLLSLMLINGIIIRSWWLQIRGMHTLIREKDISKHDFVFYSDRLIRLVFLCFMSFPSNATQLS